MMQPLTNWDGGVESLIDELKRRSGAQNDIELASAIGASRSSISNWRKRRAVPKAVLLRCENLDANVWDKSAQYTAARMVVIRLAEFGYQSLRHAGSKGDRYLSYSLTAAVLPHLTEIIAVDIAKRQVETGRLWLDIAKDLIEDEGYLKKLWDWFSEQSAEDIVASRKLPQ